MQRVGIVGLAGQIGSVHAARAREVLANFDNWGLAFCSSNEAVRNGHWSQCRANNLGEEIPDHVDVSDMAVYSNFDELIADPSVVLVVIATPTALHKAQTIAALEAGKHVLCEKPLAFEIADVEDMLKTASAQKRMLMCGQILGWFDDFAWLYNKLQASRRQESERRYGKLQRLTLWREIAVDNHTADPANAEQFAGPWLDLLAHDTHFLVALLGRPALVTARGLVLGTDFVKTVDASYRFRNTRAVVEVRCGATLSGGATFAHGFEVQFEQYTFAYGSSGPGLHVIDHETGLCTPQGIPRSDCSPFALQLMAAIECVEQKRRDMGLLASATAAEAVKLCHRSREAVLAGITLEH